MGTMADLRPYRPHPYWVGVPLLALAAVLGARGEFGLTVGALAIAGLTLWILSGVLRHLASARAQSSALDRQLIQSQKLAAIGELSAGIAHEINNPLAIIGQEVEWVRHLLLQETGGKNTQSLAELQDSLQEIVRQVDRCKEITHKLLDFARKQEPLLQSVDVNKLIEDMVRLVEKEAVHKEIRVVRNYRQDLPLVDTDPPLLRQVILNLLNNATYAIGSQGEITVATRLAGDRTAEILVSDSGCGIAEADREKIFDPFFTTKPQGKGTGLGLSICHGIIMKLGGEIRVASEVAKGTTFAIRLPLQRGKGDR